MSSRFKKNRQAPRQKRNKKAAMGGDKKGTGEKKIEQNWKMNGKIKKLKQGKRRQLIH